MKCNHTRHASIFFVSVSMDKFRIIGIVMSSFFILFGTASIIFHNVFRRASFGAKEHFVTEALTVDRKIVTLLGLNTLTFALCIGHVESLRLYNHPENGVDGSWGFGQVLPVFLLTLPAGRTISLFISRINSAARTRTKNFFPAQAPLTPRSTSSLALAINWTPLPDDEDYDLRAHGGPYTTAQATSSEEDRLPTQ
ncbi:hypothetical protein D9615_008013 [Tricholomella constricta]|uniref:Uncharacterized protein n=1 Tax=Tricholomella constricta TaxID=117010 RepID=A0A8H5H2W7_9AGAR|nr:hypothetical protein D9615_008013 [Tricholomella constricta]